MWDECFNGLYGLNRGLAAAALALAAAVLVLAPGHWMISIGLLGISGIYLYRMQRFGIHYAREIYNQFLLLPTQAAAKQPSARNDPLGGRGSPRENPRGDRRP